MRQENIEENIKVVPGRKNPGMSDALMNDFRFSNTPVKNNYQPSSRLSELNGKEFKPTFGSSAFSQTPGPKVYPGSDSKLALTGLFGDMTHNPSYDLPNSPEFTNLVNRFAEISSKPGTSRNYYDEHSGSFESSTIYGLLNESDSSRNRQQEAPNSNNYDRTQIKHTEGQADQAQYLNQSANNANYGYAPPNRYENSAYNQSFQGTTNSNPLNRSDSFTSTQRSGSHDGNVYTNRSYPSASSLTQGYAEIPPPQHQNYDPQQQLAASYPPPPKQMPALRPEPGQQQQQQYFPPQPYSMAFDGTFTTNTSYDTQVSAGLYHSHDGYPRSHSELVEDSNINIVTNQMSDVFVSRLGSHANKSSIGNVSRATRYKTFNSNNDTYTSDDNSSGYYGPPEHVSTEHDGGAYYQNKRLVNNLSQGARYSSAGSGSSAGGGGARNRYKNHGNTEEYDSSYTTTSLNAAAPQFNPSSIQPKKDRSFEPAQQRYNGGASVTSGVSSSMSRKPAPTISLQTIRKYEGRQQADVRGSVDSDSGSASGLRSSRESLRGVNFSSHQSPVSYKAQEQLVESPRSKSAYKEFWRQFRNKEKVSVEAAKQYALDVLRDGFPESVRYRVYMELADLAKRNNDFAQASQHFYQVCKLQPKAVLGWLEWSRMEEENGRLRKALKIVTLGLQMCSMNEGLLTRMIRLHERLHNYDAVRGMLSNLKHETIEKAWRSILEGSLFEARTGNIAVSRKLFKFLMKNIAWYGPIYFEAFRLEEKDGNDDAAVKIITKGLGDLPRYGPLWFGLLRIMERKDILQEMKFWILGYVPRLLNINREASVAAAMVSKELIWKVYFEKAQIEERAAEVASRGAYYSQVGDGEIAMQQFKDMMLRDCKQSLVKSLLVCPENLRWKVLLIGARLETTMDKIDNARKLLKRAFRETPEKSRYNVYLECARLEEYVGNIQNAREILRRARASVRHEWKVFLESILLEARNGNLVEALLMARYTCKVHASTGRLWAVYIQLAHRTEHMNRVKLLQGLTNDMHRISIANEEQMAGMSSSSADSSAGVVESTTDFIRLLSKEKIIRHAIAETPKSGEVWCERGRCHLNPLNLRNFDLTETQKSLNFALHFTPQYGDVFVEIVRYEMLAQVLLPRILNVLRIPWLPFYIDFLADDCESDTIELLAQVLKKKRVTIGDTEFQHIMNHPVDFFQAQARRSDILAIERLEYNFGCLRDAFLRVEVGKLNRRYALRQHVPYADALRCVNADPNYGSAWFHCRRHPLEIPSLVLQQAVEIIAHELVESQDVYARAVLHFVRNCIAGRATAAEPVAQLEEAKDSLNKAGAPSPTKQAVRSASAGRSNLSKSTSGLKRQDGGGGPAQMLSRSLDGALTAAATGDLGAAASLVDAVHRDAASSTESAVVHEYQPLLRNYADTVQQYDKDIRQRELDLLKDFQLVDSQCAGFIPYISQQLLPWVAVPSSSQLFLYSDFVTGVVELSRTMFSSLLTSEGKRKNIYSSDQIIT